MHTPTSELVPIDNRQRDKLKSLLGDAYYNYCGMPIYAVLDHNLIPDVGCQLVYADHSNSKETIMFYFVERSSAFSTNCYDIKSMD